METTEKIIGKTPFGGDYMIAYYFDDEDKATTKENAKKMRIAEYTDAGERVMENYCIIQKQVQNSG